VTGDAVGEDPRVLPLQSWYDSEKLLSNPFVRQRKGPRVREDDRKEILRWTHSGRTVLLKFLNKAFFFKLS
jgi:hypothetical protein